MMLILFLISTVIVGGSSLKNETIMEVASGSNLENGFDEALNLTRDHLTLYADAGIDSGLPLFATLSAPLKYALGQAEAKQDVSNVLDTIDRNFAIVQTSIERVQNKAMCAAVKEPLMDLVVTSKKSAKALRVIFKPHPNPYSIETFRKRCKCRPELPINTLFALLEERPNVAMICMKSGYFEYDRLTTYVKDIKNIGLILGLFAQACYDDGFAIRDMDVVMQRLRQIWKIADNLKQYHYENVVKNGLKKQIESLILPDEIKVEGRYHSKLTVVKAKISQILSAYKSPKEEYSAFFWITESNGPCKLQDAYWNAAQSNSTIKFERNNVGVLIYRRANTTKTQTLQIENKRFFAENKETMTAKLCIKTSYFSRLLFNMAQQQLQEVSAIRQFPISAAATYGSDEKICAFATQGWGSISYAREFSKSPDRPKFLKRNVYVSVGF